MLFFFIFVLFFLVQICKFHFISCITHQTIVTQSERIVTIFYNNNNIRLTMVIVSVTSFHSNPLSLTRKITIDIKLRVSGLV